MKFWYIYGNTFSKYLHGTWSLLNILIIFGIKENLIIWTHTMYFWQLLQIYSSDLRLVLWSRITVFIFFEVGLPVIYIWSIYCIFKLLFSSFLTGRPVSAWECVYSFPLQPPHGLPVCVWTEQHALWIVGKGPGTPTEGFPWHWPDDNKFPSCR